VARYIIVGIVCHLSLDNLLKSGSLFIITNTLVGPCATFRREKMMTSGSDSGKKKTLKNCDVINKFGQVKNCDVMKNAK
jgi:F0F1-type ATP synthase assembly protein I